MVGIGGGAGAATGAGLGGTKACWNLRKARPARLALAAFIADAGLPPMLMIAL